jgi:ergothioneine biosynthesis protein EgtB
MKLANQDHFHSRQELHAQDTENLASLYSSVRRHTEQICNPLQTEDYVLQPVVDVSPPKWHLGHTTWFFETFILMPFAKGYKAYHPDYNFIFNSYYETAGARVMRTDRGNLSRPTVEEVYAYRGHVDHAMHEFLAQRPLYEVKDIFLLGLNHEQQHQELLYTDIKYILGHNPLFPIYSADPFEEAAAAKNNSWIHMPEGMYEIGYDGTGFCFDNERARHKVYLQPYLISGTLVTNAQYLQFMQDGGYENFRYWHADGWEWVKSKAAKAPLYWHLINGKWHRYMLNGLQEIKYDQLVTHINYYEASAFAAWCGMRLPTEAEWEAAALKFHWGERWEWTQSAYLPYPGFHMQEGAIGEYNGKFMVNQMVLRGASIATAPGQSRMTYRNFFQPYLQWQFTGIRLVK